ncbi:MAG: ribonuclease III [Clostridia bacterium]|jgi:ribonuclease-3 family protein|nr:ribonuclease III [Clostridia bacterium]
MTEEQAFLTKPLVLAYIGDSVFELYIRLRLTEVPYRDAHDLHVKSIRYVKASAQAKLVAALEPELTDREKAVVRFGRNAHSNTVPRNADLGDYHAATGFEALLGYLKLSGQTERLAEILDKAYALG